MDKFTEAEINELIEISEKFPTIVDESLLSKIYTANCESGNVDIVKFFLDKKIIKTGCNYYAGFYRAVTADKIDIVKLILDNKEINPLHHCNACQNIVYVCLSYKKHEILELILNDGREHFSSLVSMFTWCVQYGSVPCAKVLIKKIENISPIIMSERAAYRGYLEMIKFLVEDGRFDFSPHIMNFVTKNKIEIIKVLLTKTYSNDIINNCLDEACSLKFDEIAKLLSGKIDINDVTNNETKKYLKEHILKHSELVETTKKFKDILDSMNSLYEEITALQQ
jgi:hypothetical protein